MPPSVNYQHWDGVQDPKYGYGAMLDGFIKHVPKSVKFDSRSSVHVHMGVPQSRDTWVDGQHRVLFTMWETDVLPRVFRTWSSLYDQVLVPCEHNRELFSRHHHNVSVVPLGVDRDVWAPRPRPNNPVFRFHAGGSLWRRKGLDVVVRAFNRLKLPNAELHIKAAPHALDVPKGELGDNIILNREWMTLEEQVDWYAQADCFIAASRGEGFGLMPLQAISMGIPTIVSDSTGQQQFKHLATGVVPCSKTPAVGGGKWDEPNENALCELMMDHYDVNPSETAKANAERTEDFSWVNASKKLLATIPVGSRLPESAETIKEEPRIEITMKRTVNPHIAGKNYNFAKGQRYTVSDGIHQVLFDAGVVEDGPLTKC
jgi:glycosyltransferase involved in cell wall biosynthesis